MIARPIAAVLIAGAIFLAPAQSFAGAEVSNLSTAWANLWSAGDIDAVMKLYAPEPVFLPTPGQRWEGAAEIRKNFEALNSQFKADLRMKSLVSETSGALGYDSGTFEETLVPKKGGQAIATKGSYLFVFKRGKKRAWKILEQTFTGSDSTKH